MANAAFYHYRLGRLEDAADLAARSLALQQNEKARQVMGLVCFERGEYEKAVPLLDKGQMDAAAWEALILSEVALGDLAQAEHIVDWWTSDYTTQWSAASTSPGT